MPWTGVGARPVAAVIGAANERKTSKGKSMSLRNAHLALVSGAVLVGGFAVAGCGTSTVKASDAENLVRQSTAQGSHGTATSVKCPSGVEAKAGNTLSCTFTLPDGTKGTVAVHVTSVNGSNVNLNVAGGDFHVTSGP
jgi:uncharacterized protein DUF4333